MSNRLETYKLIYPNNNLEEEIRLGNINHQIAMEYLLYSVELKKQEIEPLSMAEWLIEEI